MESGTSVSRKGYQNIHPVIGILIAHRIATLHELKTIYSMEDAMDMYEAFIIPKFNEWRELESAKRSKK
jgi:hypothetical protein